MGSKNAAQVTLALSLLLVGGAIYVVMRPPCLLLHQVVAGMGLGGAMAEGRLLAAGWQLPSWVVYCLPGALWSAAWLAIIDAILAPRTLRRCLQVGAFIPVLGVGSELMQLMGLLPGTFDVIDAVCYAAPYLAYALIVVHTYKAQYSVSFKH